MNKKYYIPTSSLNFNSILASESISPKSFYYKRRFGYSRHENVPPNSFDDYLLLYSKLPVFQIEKSADREEYPIYIELTGYNIDGKRIYDKDSIEIYAIQKTIYLRLKDIRIIFKNQEEKKIIISKSLQSIETKLVEKYSASFITIDNLEKTQKFEYNPIPNIEQYLSRKINLSSIIENDIRTNKIKGFIYAYIIGIVRKQPAIILKIKNEFRTLKNTYSALFNHVSSQVTETNKDKDFIDRKTQEIIDAGKQLKDKITKSTEIPNKNDLNKHLDNLEKLVRDLIQEVQKDNKKCRLINALKESDITGNLDEFLENCKKIQSGRYTFYEQLEWKFEKEIKANKNKSKKINNIDDEIKNIIKIIDEELNKKELNISKKQCTEFNKTPISNLLEITDDKKLKKLKCGENQSDTYQKIINELLHPEINGKDDIIKNKEELIRKVGLVLKNTFPDWKNSKEREYLLNFSKVVLGKAYNLKFNFNDINNSLIKSFAAFILKTETIYELEDFLSKNNVNDMSLTFGFWGATFGFSALPRTFTDVIFSKKLIKFQKNIDTFLAEQVYNDCIKLTYGVTKQPDLNASETDNTTEYKLIKTEKDPLEKIRTDKKLCKFVEPLTKCIEDVKNSIYNNEQQEMFSDDKNRGKEEFKERLLTKIQEEKGIAEKTAKKIIDKIDFIAI